MDTDIETHRMKEKEEKYYGFGEVPNLIWKIDTN